MQEGGCDTPRAAVEVDQCDAPATAAAVVAGFVETDFSSPQQQYFYENLQEECEAGTGGFAVVEECVPYCLPWLPLTSP
jgi:hypothetical protein